MRITSYPEVDISVPFDWKATAAQVTERVCAAMEDGGVAWMPGYFAD